jgi:hypothetical protein
MSRGAILQGGLILIDRVLVAPEFGQDGTQIGAGFYHVGSAYDAGLVGADGTLKIARLMQLIARVQGTLGVRSWSVRVANTGRSRDDSTTVPLTPRTRILCTTTERLPAPGISQIVNIEQ